MKHVAVERTLKESSTISSELLHGIFEEQARRRPQHTAVECNGEKISYADINTKADRLARKLRAEGAGTGALIALYMTKSCSMFVAMLGILKAGAGYVPIDPKFPAGRITAILEDANIKLILTDHKLIQALGEQSQAKIILADNGWDDNVPECEPAIVTTSDICYVIYTSGSTGRPKGVVVEHRNAVNFVRALRAFYRVDENDRIYQGFSIAFDASVEEIWAAFSCGGTLVAPSEDIARSTMDAAEFISRERISFFSTVPSFLALMTADLPSIRLLILGGEVCTSELAARWTRPGLRVLNTYGPTEATVVTTVAECATGEPVTIGSALPGYTTYVLDDSLTPVKQGEVGELYIGGRSVARGYLNRPELTAERFTIVPNVDPSARLYRTHDLVRLLDDNQLQFVGRADGQVKIRGFRVELSEIESVLMDHSAIRFAAAKVVEFAGFQEIAAYIVLDPGSIDVDRLALSEALRQRIPEYMIPKYLDIVSELPTMTSGKVDRGALPSPCDLLSNPAQDIIAPVTELERCIAEVWQRVFQLPAVSIGHDFFLDLHGHSLLAARAVTELRTALKGVNISVRDIYEHRTIQTLSAALMAREGSALKQNVRNESTQTAKHFAPLPRTRWLCATLQLVGLFAFYGIVSAPFCLAILLVLQVLDGSLPWHTAAEFATIGGFALWPSWLLLSIAIKWIVIGRYKPGNYPVWGFYYFRWWLVTRFQALSWCEMFVNTPLMSLYFRAMGAKIGRNCTIGTSVCGAFDLISVGNDTAVGPETHLLGYRIENGWLILGPVTIGNACCIGTHCCIGMHVRMADHSRLEDLSSLPDHATVHSGETKRGSPAQFADGGALQITRRHGRLVNGLFGFIHLLLIYAMGYILILSSVPAALLVAFALYGAGPLVGFAVALASVPLSILWYLKLVVVTKRLLVGNIKPGTYSTRSLTFLRYWFLNYLMTNTRHLVLPLYATLFLPRFLRSLGAKIGRKVEVSTIMHATPDLLEIGDESFLADACIVGGHKIYGGRLELHTNRVGRRTFIGNSAFVPGGVDLGDDGLIGVLSTTPSGMNQTRDETRWLGSPSFLLPSTEKVKCFSARQTFEPGLWRIAARGLVDLFRVILPGLVSMTLLGLLAVMTVISYRELSLVSAIMLIPVFALTLALVALVYVATLKNAFMGEFKPTIKPLWCSYVWFNEVVNALYEAVFCPILSPMMGTPYISWFLRLMGCKIGKWVFLETTLMSEFDLIRIGDRAALNLGSTVQTHLFEDRIMKSDTIEIGDRCSIGNMAVILYGTQMNTGSILGALSVLMKGEVLPSWSRWYGIPSQPMEIDTGRHDRERRSVSGSSSRDRLARRTNRILKQRLLASTSGVGLQVELPKSGQNGELPQREVA